MSKPFSQACENNKTSILAVLKKSFANTSDVLEVGSGNGQHAVFFAEHLPHLVWQTSDRQENHRAIHAWLDDYSGKNLRSPLPLDVDRPWPVEKVEAIFTANTLHIMSGASVERFFCGVEENLGAGGLLLVYGPFNYDGQFTSPSNARFNDWLRQQNPISAIRDFETVDALATQAGLSLHQDIAMPANNRLLIWRARE